MRAGTPLRRRTSLLLAVPAVVAVLATAGCGSSRASGASAGSQDAPVAAGGRMNLGNTGAAQDSAAAAKSASQPGDEVQQRAVISTGHIALISSDVAATRTRLDAVLARDGGRVADEDTVTDDHGTVTRAHLVVRVPSARFDDAMTSLAGIASLRSASRKAEDVTTQVIDLRARIAAERAGVRRLRHLVSQTANLRALLDVERALTQRQGELESLRQQRVYLSDQTSLATITVDVTRRAAPPPAPAAHAAGGFVGGLGHGWDALVALITAVLLALGAVLPFAVAGALIGVPVWLVLRRLRRTRRREAPAES
ncbi:MAG TPA: DUF4349 domain-containing protein [Nocardioides sp.]|uniref:DUF4349 domain-containing protein n=1 Tax=Nocardioides sp. TaxID=35761 RepID=UPI002F3F3A11